MWKILIKLMTRPRNTKRLLVNFPLNQTANNDNIIAKSWSQAFSHYSKIQMININLTILSYFCFKSISHHGITIKMKISPDCTCTLRMKVVETTQPGKRSNDVNKESNSNNNDKNGCFQQFVQNDEWKLYGIC